MISAPITFLTESRHHQQAEVDGQPETESRCDRECVHRHVGDADHDRQHQQRHHDRRDAESQRHERCDEAAEDDHQHGEQNGQGDGLADHEIVIDPVLDLNRDSQGTAGAHLDVPLLRQLWPIALALCTTRAAVTVSVALWSSRIAKDPPVLRRWGWASLISQAGLTLGLSVVVARNFPEFGEGFRSLAIATVAINEMIGPVLFKLSLDRSGEAQPAVT